MAEPAIGAAVINRTYCQRGYWVLQGQICIDSTARAIEIVPTTGAILAFSAFNNDDDDCTVRFVVNSDDGTEDSDMGTIYCQTSSADDDVYRFEASVIM